MGKHQEHIANALLKLFSVSPIDWHTFPLCWHHFTITKLCIPLVFFNYRYIDAEIIMSFDFDGTKVERIHREVSVSAIGGDSKEIMRDLVRSQYDL